jgi:TolB-like protein
VLIYEFGNCCLDAQLMELRQGGKIVHTEPQVFDLLLFLIENRGRVVDRDEVFAAVWRGRIVSDTTLSSRVNAARRAVGDDGRRQEVIRTVQRRGFRFVATVACIDKAQVPTVGLPLKTTQNEPACEDAVTASYLVDRPAIAVLPFDVSADEDQQRCLAAELAEDILAELSKFRWVRAVESLNGFGGTSGSTDAGDRGLGVRYYVHGRVRRCADTFRVTARLVEAATGSLIWADRVDGCLDDTFALQDQISQRIAGAIEASVLRCEIARAQTRQAGRHAGYNNYLRALPHIWANTWSDSTKALGYLHKALSTEEPHVIGGYYAAAHGLAAVCHAMRYNQGGLDLNERYDAVRHARAVLANDGDNANALAFAGMVLATLEQDVTASLEAVDKAVALCPNSSRTHTNRAVALLMNNRNEEALKAAQVAKLLSPLDPMRYGTELVIGAVNLINGRLDCAIEAARNAVQSSPYFGHGHAILLASYVRAGRRTEAKESLQRLLQLQPRYRLGSATIATGENLAKILEPLRDVGLPD